MRVPIWLTLGVAALVLGFGGYRIWLGTRPKPTEPATSEPRGRIMGGGFYRMSPRTHLLVGVVYVLLGAALVATSFGWSPLGNMMGPDTEKPTKDTMPTKGGVPIDQLPTKK